MECKPCVIGRVRGQWPSLCCSLSSLASLTWLEFRNLILYKWSVGHCFIHAAHCILAMWSGPQQMVWDSRTRRGSPLKWTPPASGCGRAESAVEAESESECRSRLLTLTRALTPSEGHLWVENTVPYLEARECLGLQALTSIIAKIVRRLMESRDWMGLRTDAGLDLNYILLDAAALRDVTALQFVSTLWAAAVCSVSTVGSCPERSGLPTSLCLRLGAFLLT